MNDVGYQITEDVLSPRECEAIAAELSHDARLRSRAGARHLMCQRTVATLAADRRMLCLAEAALGKSAVPFRATLFEKTALSNWLVVWHQDTALPVEAPFTANGWGPWSIKAGVHYAHAPSWALNRVVALRVHLDSSTLVNDPLRVLPGTHRAGVLSDDEVFELARVREPTACLVARGGVCAMNPLLIHSSSKGQSGEPRRVIHIEYADALELSPGIRLAVA